MAEYQELRIRFERTGDAEGGYRVFASGPAGEAAGAFRLPYSDVEVENLVLKLSRPRSGVRRIDSSDLDLVRGFGGGLFDAVFSGRVRDVYRSSLASARNEGCGMRISLALTGTPELMHVPWEYLYDDPAFLSISMWTPVVRYLDLASSRRPLKVEPPLRILAMVSSPSDIAQLDVEQERAKLEESLARLVAQGAVEIRLAARRHAAGAPARAPPQRLPRLPLHRPRRLRPGERRRRARARGRERPQPARSAAWSSARSWPTR